MVIFTHIIQNNLRLNQNMTRERIYDLANKQDASNLYFAHMYHLSSFCVRRHRRHRLIRWFFMFPSFSHKPIWNVKDCPSTFYIFFVSIGNSKGLLVQSCFLIGWNLKIFSETQWNCYLVWNFLYVLYCRPTEANLAVMLFVWPLS